MNQNRSFTGAVYRHLLNDPDTPKTVREWVRAEADPEERAMYLAMELAEDMMAPFRAEPDRHDPPDTALRNQLMLLALDKVNWGQVAEALLRHFTLPVLVASPVPDRRCPARFTWSPAAWRCPVN
jgi:hypothetical protein